MEQNNKEKMEFSKFTLFCLALLIVGSYFVSGIYGLRIVLALIFLTIPFYLIISLFDFNLSEKIIYSLFISFAGVALFIYWINQIIYSYRMSIAIFYILLIAVYFTINILIKKKEDTS